MFTATGLASTEIPWTFVQGRPLIKLHELDRLFSIRSYYDHNRVLLEGEDKKQAFFLPWGSYAVIDGRFRRLKTPLRVKEGNLYIDAALVQAHLMPFIPLAKRKWAGEQILGAFSKVRYPVCALERAVRKVFLDPGHGGIDQGAVWGQVKEKDLVLQFARYAMKELKALGFEVLLSRKEDDFLPLELRTVLAEAWGADIFISIHANSSPSFQLRGTETYILSSNATDARARKLAMQENFLDKQSPLVGRTLQNILWDIGQSAYLQDSAYLAAHVQKSLVSAAQKPQWRNGGVREAPFFVLSTASVPAILVELAYLSNPEDRRMLQDRKFQQVLARALAKGVVKYAEYCNSSAKKKGKADAKGEV